MPPAVDIPPSAPRRAPLGLRRPAQSPHGRRCVIFVPVSFAVVLSAYAAWTFRRFRAALRDAIDLATKVYVPNPESPRDWPELRVEAVVPDPRLPASSVDRHALAVPSRETARGARRRRRRRGARARRGGPSPLARHRRGDLTDARASRPRRAPAAQDLRADRGPHRRRVGVLGAKEAQAAIPPPRGSRYAHYASRSIGLLLP